MVVGVLAPVLGLALALPTGLLFGLGYGTGVRVGYEQLYPLLFPAKDVPRTAQQVKETIIGMNTVYNAIGGKEASQMGMGMGVQAAGDLLANPDFEVLEELESRLSGRTPGKSNKHKDSDKDILKDSNNPGFYSFEWIQDFMLRIGLAERPALLSFRAFLEHPDALKKLKQGDITILLQLINQALETEGEKKGADGNEHTQKFRDTFEAMLAELSASDITAMYQNRSKYFTWQRQMIVLEYRRRNEDKAPETDYQRRRRIYSETRDTHMALLKKDRQDIKDTIQRGITMGPGGGAVVAGSLSLQYKKLNADKKLLMNYITLSRNDLTLKSLANNDWNKRIWNIE